MNVPKKNCPPTHVEEQPQHKHKIKHDKTTMQFFSLLYVLSNITYHRSGIHISKRGFRLFAL